MRLKLATFYDKTGQEAVGIVKDGLLFPLDDGNNVCRDMIALIAKYDDKLKAYLEALTAEKHRALPLDGLRLAAPIPCPRHDVICLGMNYLEHAIETARFKGVPFQPPDQAVYFSKRVNRAPGTGEAIPRHAKLTQQLDYEVELAIIIGKECTGATRENAFDYIFGYTIINDASTRDLQLIHGGQFYFSKSLNGLTPMGPWIVTADELPDPSRLKVRSLVNGEPRQNSDTSQLIFDIPHIISELSAGITLFPGDIIATGTPSGVGMGLTPPRYLSSGDVVRCEVEGIGELINQVE